ncbi:hypothetical protein PFISCL1PPCAC_3377, partial [Pristionchus fissidentatus]
QDRIPIYLSKFPGGTSKKNMIHWWQNSLHATSRFDYGPDGNVAAYGTANAPVYSYANYTIPTSIYHSPTDHLVSDADMILQIIQFHGYPAEEHHTTTQDGYILTMHRIPHGSFPTPRRVVLLQHGLFSSSFDFVSLLPEKSLSYYLADSGYDVWIGNNRGNIYSNSHVNFSSRDNRFWDFS